MVLQRLDYSEEEGRHEKVKARSLCSLGRYKLGIKVVITDSQDPTGTPRWLL